MSDCTRTSATLQDDEQDLCRHIFRVIDLLPVFASSSDLNLLPPR
ncbi:hypothetical protein F385_1430 [Pantoea agglomerans 299R]|nr:hypothetical protein F385_1430 [Pantoea agglomerans 299R]